MQKNLMLILILIIAIFSNFTFAAGPLKWRRAELVKRSCNSALCAGYCCALHYNNDIDIIDELTSLETSPFQELPDKSKTLIKEKLPKILKIISMQEPNWLKEVVILLYARDIVAVKYVVVRLTLVVRLAAVLRVPNVAVINVVISFTLQQRHRHNRRIDIIGNKSFSRIT
ncbi:hypothetical protein Glove_29g144 [Diversispora epigaea]|uniref:Uncharacterized protein n=1 Tax=Diversispora epigaea TaxID=1348612 RepID=A0A397JRQ0_9GLOM|nr:hypothetical protein Glove_29g144 [Diversispora epigaea]